MIEIEKYLKLGLRFVFMDILIESTRGFEKDIDKLSRSRKPQQLKKSMIAPVSSPLKKLMFIVICIIFP